MGLSGIKLPPNTALHRSGHVLVLSGWWGQELLDELSVAFTDLKLAMPRHSAKKTATLHLFNFTLDLDATSGALSLMRRSFLADNIEISIVAEGALQGAGVIFLAAAPHSRIGTRSKIYDDCFVQCSLSSARWSEVHSMGFAKKSRPRATVEQTCREIRHLGDEVVALLAKGEAWTPSPQKLMELKLVEKVIRSSHELEAQ